MILCQRVRRYNNQAALRILRYQSMIPMLHISIVTEQDIPAVTRVVNAAYQGAPDSKSWTAEGHLVAGLRTTEKILTDLFHQPTITLLKCTNDAGVILGSVLLEQKEGTLYLGMLSVDPYEQAAGIGARLLQAGEDFAREHQYSSITITVIDQRHELIDWYRRKGFVPTGKLEPFANASSAALGAFSFMEMKKELQ